MSFNKIHLIAALIFSLNLLSCNEQGKEAPENNITLNTPEAILKEARSVLGPEVQITVTGNFYNDTTKRFAAGTEINKPEMWGIKFYLLKQDGQKINASDSTALLEGSFSDALVRKEKLPSMNYDLLYYNSLDYYLGSGGGEVFAYLVDFEQGQTYAAHLFTEKRRKISLFISDNTIPEAKNYFLSTFKKDYPDLKIVDKDIDLDE